MKTRTTILLISFLICIGMKAQGDGQQTVLDGAYIREITVVKEALQDFGLRQQVFIEDTLSILKIKNLPKALRGIKEEMSLFTGGEFISGNTHQYRPTTNDTTLLFKNDYQEIHIDPFLLGCFEITNGEYQQFVHAVIDSLERDMLHQAEIEGYAIPCPSNRELPGDQKGYKINFSTPIDMNDEETFDVIWDGLYLQGADRYWNEKAYDARKIKFRFFTDTIENVIPIYPDTTVWQYNAASKSLVEVYFWHPAYENYPIVGITYDQALAFCHWKNKLLKLKLAAYPEIARFVKGYRLPTRYEWEYVNKVLPSAYYYVDKELAARRHRIHQKLDREKCNLACIEDVNNFQSAVHCFDAFELTCASDEMDPNMFGVYHLKGNVAEWTMSNLASDTLQSTLEIKNNFNSKYLNNTDVPISEMDDVLSIKEKLKESNPPLRYSVQEPEYDSLLTLAAQILLHDFRVKNAGEDLKYVCGGSWKDNPVYTELPQLIPATEHLHSVGFRLVLDIEPEAIPFFIEEEYWKLYKATRDKKLAKKTERN